MAEQMPSIDAWLAEAKADPSFRACGMYLVHNGTVRETPKAEVRGVETDGVRPGGKVDGMTFAYGGIMMGLWLLLRPQGMVINNGIVYFDISPPLLIAATLISYGIISLIRRFHHSAPAGEQLFRITVSLDKRQVECGALLDTGNTLRDLFTDTPVVVMDFDACQSLLPAPIRPVFAGMCDPPPSIPVEGFRLIPYSAVGGKGLLPAFSPDYVEISSGRKKQRYDKVYVAVSKEKLSDHYEALIGSQLWRS